MSGRIRRYLKPPPYPPGLAVLGAGERFRDGWAEHLWTTLATLDQRDTELHRHHALLTAVAWARDHGVSPDDPGRQQAERDIAAEHGVENFLELELELAPFPEFLAEIHRYRDLLALAKRVRVTWSTRRRLQRPEVSR